MVNLNRLHCFYVCAQAKQITKAASVLGVSQPSLSQQIKIFEEELGFELFVRSSKSFDLTHKGQALYERSIELFDNVESIEGFIENKKTVERPRFTIGVSDEIERPFVAELVGKLLKTKKGSLKRFQVLSKEHDHILEQFKDGNTDVLITTRPIPKIKPSAIFDFPIVLVTSAKQKLHIRNENIKVVLKTLQEGLVMPSEELPLRSDIDAFLSDNNLEVPLIFESNIFACLTRAIKDGIGCGFIPLPYVLSDFKKEQFFVVGPSKGYWQMKIYLYKNENADSSLCENLSQLIYSYL